MKNKIVTFLIPVIMILATAAGYFVGHYLNTSAQETYESNATFQINWSMIPADEMTANEYAINWSVIDQPHDTLVVSRENMMQTINVNGLINLLEFEECENEEAAAELMNRNLDAWQDSDEPTIFHVSYRAGHPRDAQTVLSNLVRTYEECLQKSASEQWDECGIQLRAEFETLQGRMNSALSAAGITRADYDKALADSLNGTELPPPIAGLKPGMDEIEAARIAAFEKTGFSDMSLSNRESKKGYSFRIFGLPVEGEKIFPLPLTYLLPATLAGFLIGLGVSASLARIFLD